MLVWNPKSEERGEYLEHGIPMRNHRLPYWLEYLRSAAGRDIAVLVVQSQCDNVEDEQPEPVQAAGQFAFVRTVKCSAKKPRGLPALQAHLAEAVEFIQEQAGALEIGLGWAKIRDWLRKLLVKLEKDQSLPPDKRKHRVLTLDEFAKQCAKVGGISSWKTLLYYLHETGVVFYQEGLFGNQIVLDQTWALDAIYAVFDRASSFRLLSGNGRFTRSDLAAVVWRKYSEAEQKLFLRMMEQCGICFRHRDRWRQSEDPEYVAPDLLPDRPAVAEALAGRWDDSAETVILRFEYRFLHERVLRQVICRIGQSAGDTAVYWRHGLWLFEKNSASRALIESRQKPAPDTPGAGEIEVRLQGDRITPFLQTLRQLILEAGGDARPREFCVSKGRTVEIDPQKSQHAPPDLEHLPENELTRLFSEAGLQKGPDLKEMAFENRPLPQKEHQPEVFFSYAWGEPTPEGRDREKLVEELYRAVNKSGCQAIMDKHELRSGDLISDFMDRIGAGKLVLVFISDKYLRSTDCMWELFQIFRRSNGDKREFLSKIVPIVCPDAKFGTLSERAVYSKYWREKEKADAKIIKEDKESVSAESFAEWQRMGEFARNVDAILKYVNDKLMPRSFDDLRKTNFREVLELLPKSGGLDA